MTGLEVVVRPVVLPNIRPTSPRVLAPVDNPEQGIVTLTGGGAKWVSTRYSWSVNLSKNGPQKELKRQFNVERVYQMDDGGNINKENFVDVERLKKIKIKTEVGDRTDSVKIVYKDPPERDNVEVKLEDQLRGTNEDPGTFISGEGGTPAP